MIPAAVLAAFQDGIIERRADGSVWRIRRRLGSATHPVIPRRIDHAVQHGGRRIVIRDGKRTVSCGLAKLASV